MKNQKNQDNHRDIHNKKNEMDIQEKPSSSQKNIEPILKNKQKTNNELV